MQVSKKTKAALIGRWQPWHIGHQDIAERLINAYSQLIIVIGSSDRCRTKRCPLNASERKFIISESLKKHLSFFEIHELKDHPDDQIWAENLYSIIGSDTQIYSSNPNVCSAMKSIDVSIEKIDYHYDISGTKIRSMIRGNIDIQGLVIQDIYSWLMDHKDLF